MVALVAKPNIRYPIDFLFFYFIVLSRMKNLVSNRPDNFSRGLIDIHCKFVITLKSFSCFLFCNRASSANSVVPVSHNIELIGDIGRAFEFRVNDSKATSMLHFAKLDCEWIAAGYSHFSKQVNVKAISCHYFILDWSLLESLTLMVQKLSGRLWERLWYLLVLHKSFIIIKNT